MPAIDLSIVLTVYNKEDSLIPCLNSLENQGFKGQIEFIFVDDGSTDQSVSLIKKKTRSWPHVHLIRNQKNKGPAVRLNQGCKAAKGQFLFLMDSDDLLIKGALQAIWNALRKEKADLFYGRWKRLKKDETFSLPTLQNFSYDRASNPLLNILEKNYTGMIMMVARDLYAKSDGADERLFVQDQSLALHLGFSAKKLLLGHTVLLWAPSTPSQLSRNQKQQHRDGFYAFWYMLEKLQKQPGYANEKRWLFRRLVSVVWKARRHQKTWWPFFLFYAFVKYGRPSPFCLQLLARSLP